MGSAGVEDKCGQAEKDYSEATESSSTDGGVMVLEASPSAYCCSVVRHLLACVLNH
jgi:hypothetical protein